MFSPSPFHVSFLLFVSYTHTCIMRSYLVFANSNMYWLFFHDFRKSKTGSDTYSVKINHHLVCQKMSNLQSLNILLGLRRCGGSDDHGRNVRVFQAPCNGQLRRCTA
ncbi:uncharacterized protein BYT42DRAFT_189252 [Radiomyces spectabilis]|uniref:uncharacterized protein n=1 Tax=Radiomyces spectabilis TaxID=64574 RepID=UPI00221E9A50|nr:uncharacterized protein BYT42DRAFT_189252 [Radiomyces spectabilis]KAI8391302.1 hypothetical protein BYT42DRAFT_189252 [Radiomyces spectabilis]